MIEDQNRNGSSKTTEAPAKETNKKKKIWNSLKLSVGISYERNH